MHTRDKARGQAEQLSSYVNQTCIQQMLLCLLGPAECARFELGRFKGDWKQKGPLCNMTANTLVGGITEHAVL